MRDDMISQLIARMKDIERQLHDLQRAEVSGSSSPNAVVYSGTPTAGQLGQWTGAGTLTHSGYAGSAVTQYSGVPTAGAITYWAAAGTVAAAGFGTADVVRTADAQTIAGEKTFTESVFARDFRLGTLNMTDDSAVLYAAADIPERGMLLIHTGQAAEYAMVLYRRTSTVFATTLFAGADLNVTTTTVLTGTTGTDGKITISVTTAGIYVENRRGSSRAVNAVILAGFN